MFSRIHDLPVVSAGGCFAMEVLDEVIVGGVALFFKILHVFLQIYHGPMPTYLIVLVLVTSTPPPTRHPHQ